MIYIIHVKRDNQLLIRLLQQEREAFEIAANAAGVSLSAWVRERLRSAAIQELQQIGKRAQFLEHIPLRSHGD